jgi:superfamily II DNA or RNA helicase
MSPTAPEQDALVLVRNRRYVVRGVAVSELGADVSAAVSEHRRQHLLHLRAIDDDAGRDDLEVVWELEPGARLIESTDLPEGSAFDPPARLDAFMDAIRWGVLAAGDRKTLHAPFRSGIEHEAYQLDPVVRALAMPRVNLLIADDVGLGKTVETGLVIQELLLRHRARNVLVVCPAGLLLQWRDQMRDKFGLDFRIVDAELLRSLRRSRGLNANPWDHFPRLITSIDFLKRPQPFRRMRDLLPAPGQPAFPRRFDLLVVDEAHNVVDAGGGTSLRANTIAALAPHFEHRIFLTATPHNGYSESFQALLALVDDQRFHRDLPPDHAQLHRVMIRRLKTDIVDDLGEPRFPKRRLVPLRVEWPEAERAAHRALHAYTERRTREADPDERRVAEFLVKILKKRFFSSPEAFRTTLEGHLLALTQPASAAPRPNVSRSVLSRHLDEFLADDAEYTTEDDDLRESAVAETVTVATHALPSIAPRDRALLDELMAFARTAAGRPDAKARCLVEFLRAQRKASPDRRVIVFTEYRATQKWLLGILVAEGLGDAETIDLIYGGMEPDKREAVKASFQADPAVSPLRILLATDAASEGVDLQNWCADLVHYEIPWNPNRMEQRNGRIDRHGQRDRTGVRIHHFVGAGFEDVETLRASGAEVKVGELEGDLEFLFRAAVKMETIRRDLHGKVGPVLAEQVEQAMLGRRRRLDTHRAEETSAAAQALLRSERNLRETLRNMAHQLDETRAALHLTPDRIETVVRVGLELARQPPLEPLGAHASGARVFRLPALTGSWAACSEGLAHPHTHALRPVTFDPEAIRGRDDVVLAHLNHRLVQMCLRLLRAEVWADPGQRRLQRISARLVDDAVAAGPAVLAWSRLVIYGADHERLHEELMPTAGLVVEGRFKPGNVRDAERLSSVEGRGEVPAPFADGLRRLWPDMVEPVRKAITRRAGERAEQVYRELAKLAEDEQARVRALLEEFRRQLDSVLNEGPVAETAALLLPLPGLEAADPLADVRRHADALRRRRESIDDEIARETERIERRFAKLEWRVFPVAVTFLVPGRSAR